ncbi:translation initiation factor IF-3 [Prevotella disiens]|uniref:Translation initiation factor IF-3 n=4 Tax=Prevotella disiens TaxID=28130 RepID=A0A379DYB3_9BACT|nr:translation initiation factor IF-3 [Prevotella disiens]EFL45602.1 translation initiation factor IF-3 [Prevotella disiens FB035-09AN]ERJ81138.1 translation initiation factor IF-3 [Prevotella disiens JCM 6334 = ATCC 29426]KGF50524.1 translation initiation factor IF-3 [Prevotella disiens DNF00882]RGK99086.1 translation initiation factor IF-3 [Prevotella disiens]SUB85458.1 Translation initiation factor IF-3 [Prevotella disiens]
MKNDKMKFQYRVNEQIHAREVRVISDEGAEVMSARKALDIARKEGVDLVEISPNAQPPVCRIIDYSKFLYQQKKHQKEMKQKQVKQEIKEIRFGPQTDEHDYQFKLKHAQEFLNDGNKVRAYVFFRGRSILFKEQGEVLLLRFANDLEELAKVEQLPKLEGKKMFLYLAPKKTGITKKSQQRRDREEAQENAKNADTKVESKETENVDNGLFANAKNGSAVLDKLKSE